MSGKADGRGQIVIAPSIFGRPDGRGEMIAVVNSTLSNNVAAAWNFNNNFNDAIGSNNLTIVKTFSGAGNISFVGGKVEQAALLDRIAYLSCPSHSTLGLSSSNNFTIACIASYTDANPNLNLAGKWSDDFTSIYYDSFPEYALRISTNSGGTGFLFQAGFNAAVVSSGITAGVYLVVGWQDASTSQLGVWVRSFNTGDVWTATTAYSGTRNSEAISNFRVGEQNPTGSPPDIWVDGLAIWRRVLSNGERNDLYNNGLGREYPYL
jgi:hypothetical protein